MTEFVGTIDNSLLQKYEVKLYGSDRDTYNIINDFLEDNPSERAFYIIDLGEITTSYATWTRLLPDVKPYYAVKCNPNPVLLDVLASLGANFDCASENEMKPSSKLPKTLPESFSPIHAKCRRKLDTRERMTSTS